MARPTRSRKASITQQYTFVVLLLVLVVGAVLLVAKQMHNNDTNSQIKGNSNAVHPILDHHDN